MPGSYISLPEKFKIVSGGIDNGTTATITHDAVSLKNCQMAWIIVNLDTIASSGCIITPMRTLAVGSAGVALANVVPIWRNLSNLATDTLVRDTDALAYTTAGNADYKIVVFQIDPANLGGSYDCIYVTTGALAITESVDVIYLLETRYAQATPPAAITD